MAKEQDKLVSGWREWVALSKLGINRIKAKVDTGARSSALHAYNIKPYIAKNGRKKVKFQVHPLQKNNSFIVICRAYILDQRTVRSSSGQQEERITIRTELTMGASSWPIELTLTNRDAMGFRLLLGRTAIKKKFLINSAGSFLLGT